MNQTAAEDYYTLLAVRPDGIAPVVDLVADATLDVAQAKARAMLDEHASCSLIEVWRDGVLLETIGR